MGYYELDGLLYSSEISVIIHFVPTFRHLEVNRKRTHHANCLQTTKESCMVARKFDENQTLSIIMQPCATGWSNATTLHDVP